MGPLGVQETVFIFVLALLVFGPRKLPELGRTIGKAMSEFRRASSELKATFDREMNSIERENESLKEVTRQYAVDDTSYSNNSYYDSGDYGSGSYNYETADNSPVSASAPQGADDQAGHQDTANAHADDTQSAQTAEAVMEKFPGEKPQGADDPQAVKS